MQTSTTITKDYIIVEAEIKRLEYQDSKSLACSIYHNFLCTFPKSFRLELAKLLAKDTQTNEQYY